MPTAVAGVIASFIVLAVPPEMLGKELNISVTAATERFVLLKLILPGNAVMFSVPLKTTLRSDFKLTLIPLAVNFDISTTNSSSKSEAIIF